MYSVMLSVAFAAADNSTPPVMFRLICIGLAIVNGGQLLVGFAVLFVALPLATTFGMDGLLLMTKLPQMPVVDTLLGNWRSESQVQEMKGKNLLMKACSNSGDWVTAAGPK